MKFLAVKVFIVLAAGGLEAGLLGALNQAQAADSVYVLPEKPWSSVELSSRVKKSHRYLSLPSLQAPVVTLEEPPPPREVVKKRKKLREIESSDSGAGFVSLDPMAISGRTSKPSLPFDLVREKIERSYNLPSISPVEALKSSTEKFQ